jgi:hypothetical protein
VAPELADQYMSGVVLRERLLDEQAGELVPPPGKTLPPAGIIKKCLESIK